MTPPRRSSTRGSARSQATFVRTGTFERRSEATDAVISSEDVLAQRPPQRLHRQLGGVDGRDDRRAIVCPADRRTVRRRRRHPARFGDPDRPHLRGGRRDRRSQALRTLVEGPVAGVRGRATSVDGCFELAQQRVEPRAPFGVEARASASTRRPARRPTAGSATPAGSSRCSPSRTSSATVERRRPRADEGGTGGRRPRHVPVPGQSRSDAVGGSRNPRPVPVLTGGGDDRRSLGQSAHRPTTLSGFLDRASLISRSPPATLREVDRGVASRPCSVAPTSSPTSCWPSAPPWRWGACWRWSARPTPATRATSSRPRWAAASLFAAVGLVAALWALGSLLT